MARRLDERPGTVLLFRKENTDGAYTFLSKIIEKTIRRRTRDALTYTIARLIAQITLDKLAELFKHDYIHAELVLPRGHILAAWFNGVVKYTPTAEQAKMLRVNTDVFVPVVELDPVKLEQAAAKYVGKQYDFTSLILNFITQVRALGNEVKEEQLENALLKYYDNSEKMICSEVIARIYEELGYKIERSAEYTTPDDIAQSQLFQKV